MTHTAMSWRQVVWELPILSLMLLINQSIYEHDDKMIDLGTKELIDRLDQMGGNKLVAGNKRSSPQMRSASRQT